MADNNMLNKEEQQPISNLYTEISKGLVKQIRLLERINISLIILIIMAILGMVGYVLLHLPFVKGCI